MPTTIREKADYVATFRFINVYLMETLARWVPTTPELEAKVLFGHHLWDFAQHADALGKRTHELRAAMHFTLRPTAPFMASLEALAALQGTGERVEGFYQGILKNLESKYRRYLDETNQMQDQPTVRIIERLLFDLARMERDYERFCAQRPDIRPQATDWPAQQATWLEATDDFVDFRPATPQTAEIA